MSAGRGGGWLAAQALALHPDLAGAAGAGPSPGGQVAGESNVHWLLVALVLGLAALEGWRRWRRSSLPNLVASYRSLAQPSYSAAVKILWIEVFPVHGGEAAARNLGRLARLLEWSGHPVRRAMAPVVRTSIPLLGVIRRMKDPSYDFLELRAGAASLLARAGQLEALAEKDKAEPAFLRFLAQQERIYAALYKSANLQQLAGQAEDLEIFLEKRKAWPDSKALVTIASAALTHRVAQLPSQLARLPSPEDRALMIGRALSEVLTLVEEERQGRRGVIGGRVGLELLRQHLTAALRELRERAEIQLELRSRTLPTRRESLVVVDLRNTGQGYAENIEVLLEDATGLKVITQRQHLAALQKQQTARLEFAVEHQRGDRVRLCFRLSWDDLERGGHQAVFADVVELRRGAERATTFRPLRPNPYVVGRPLRESDVFIGRDETFAKIASSLAGANQDNVVVLMGQRRMGKTSILRQLGERLGPGYAPVLVDLQGILGRGEAVFLREIAGAICDGLETLGIRVEEPPAASFGEDAGRFFRQHFLRPITRLLGERRLLVAFDEFEVLGERIAAGDLPDRILPYFRSLMQHEPNISFLFAGTHRLDQLTGDYWGALFNLAIYLEIGHLAPREVEELFLRPTRDVFEIDPLALDKAGRATGGHPHFCQLVARELVELRNEDLLEYLTIQDLNRVIQRVVRKGQLHIAYLWEEAELAERLLLLAVGELLASDGGATLTSARALIEEHYKNAPDLDLAAALRSLLRKELLAEENGRLELRIELLRHWMDQNRSVVDETWLTP